VRRDLFSEILDDVRRFMQIYTVHDNHKFVTAPAGEKIAFTDMAANQHGQFAKDLIAPLMAITVIDEYQNKGVGTILLAILYYRALCSGLRYLTGYILVENWKFAVRFLKLGATITRSGSEYEIKLPVYNDFDEFPENNYSRLFVRILKELKSQDFCG